MSVASAKTTDATVLTPTVSAQPMLLVATASSSSADGTGSYGATPLKGSSSWNVAEQTGAFTWTYDMPVTSPGAGPAPKLGLSYNSQSVDGETASTNNQTSAVGEGWDLSASGFVERSYVPCAKDDGPTGAVTTSGDLCWKSDNATVSFAGHSGPLVKDSTSGKWRLEHDDGTRFEHLTGTAQGCQANGTVSTDCWKMTTTDGTQYFFGLNQLPGWSSGQATTNSTWTVPVYGNDPGEPCNTGTFATSSCMQAWRWNLDYVVDVHGNAEALYYTAETNKYAKGGSGATTYQRGGVLSKIEYGLRASNVYGANAAGFRVNFTYDSRGRCSDASGATCTTGTLDNATMPATPSAYPDVPFDQLCTGTSCSASQIGPSFFTNANLTKVDAQVLVSGAYSTVNSWALSHSFPAPGDGTSPALWLTQVQRTGTAAGQAAIVEPATVFSGTTMQNRVWVIDGLAPLDKWRLSSIQTSLGAVISVNYQGQQCTPAQASAILADLPNNTNWCFPEWWVPQGSIPVGGRQDLFHKYPVASIIVDPRTGGPLSKTKQTQYFYGTPRWRYNDSPLTVANARSWNIFAGVDTVEVREGAPAAPANQKVSKYTYYQGMNGDRASTSGGTKTVTVTGTTIPDDRWFGGQTYRQQTLAGVSGASMTDLVSTPWASPVTSNDGTRQARFTAVGTTVTTEPLSTGGNRTLTTSTTFDNTYGYPLTVSKVPSDAGSTCTTTTYAAANTTAWVIGLPSEVRTLAVSCPNAGSAVMPTDLVSDVKTTYDGGTWGAAPTRGLATSTQALDRYDGATAHWTDTGSATYDALGRSLVKTDPLGHTTTTAYTPATTLPVTSTTTTNTAPFSWVTTTTYDESTGAVTSVVDPNGSRTDVSIDALGRTSQVWLPLVPKATNPTSPSMAYTYTLSQTAPNAVKTDKRTGGGTVTSYELYDGLARSVQTQSLAGGGGTVVKTTNYDDQGRSYFVDNEYWTSSVTPSTAFFTPTSESNVPSQVITTYDAVGRALTSVLNGTGTEVSRTTNAYLGADRVDTVPPTGGTAASTFTNALGQKTKLTQYLTGAISGTGQATTYGYDGAGRMSSMLDPAGNTWTWTYDLLGHRVGQKDPDSGTSSATYDLAGNMTSTTDARGQLITTTYDELNRKTKMFSGDTLGPLLASWTYDTVKKGLVTESTTYTDSGSGALGIPGIPGKAYKTTVGSYDAAGNPTKTTVSLPSDAPAFGGTSFTKTIYYNVDSTLLLAQFPAVGGLPAENLRYSYDSWGRLSGLSGYTGILANTVYTPIGQLSQFNRNNGTTSAFSTYGYDGATGDVLQITDNAVFGGSGHYVADRAYTRDKVGNVTSSTVNSVLPTVGTQTTCYNYDGLRELTRAWTPNASSTCATTPSASAMGGIAPMWNDYTYDTQTGNRTGLIYHDSMGVASVATYGYPATGATRPHAVGTITGPVDLGSGTYSYDSAGNQTGRPGQTLTFNEVGKVSKVVTGSTTQTNVYNPDGSLLLRVSTAEGAALLLGETTLTQPAGSTVTSAVRTYSAASGKPVAERSATTGITGTTMTWLFSTLDGTVDTQTDAKTGTTTRQYRDPFGVPLGGVTGVWSDGTGFLGKPVTASTKLTTIGARTYDHLLGKFTAVDPVVDAKLPQQNIGYAYSSNNPITWWDPSGLKPLGSDDYGDRVQRGSVNSITEIVDAMRGQIETAWDGVLAPKLQRPTAPGWHAPLLPAPALGKQAPQSPFNWGIHDPIKPGWGPLFEWEHHDGDSVGVSLSTCGLIACGMVQLSEGGHGSIAIGAGPKAALTVDVGVTTETHPGPWIGATCSAALGAGVYVSGGTELNGPPYFMGAGGEIGLGLGCSGYIGLSW
ncbi:RHS repeat-associated core domain-containing protein [Microbacterium capsulatum]|uniref:RHS repeat-associated core domain-containing protein n=1 Tax=Microbacterium capsulatum TaxID=3041921 RepID=A0ABU0XFA0_9MICO|nr:RHS repeat-associated core domain-containing protein [Microbacterium sp. ASV81]MDQ4213726.1 RHS repeat-associated core domain-containing protein [Microbacterium sp. ASV81]